MEEILFCENSNKTLSQHFHMVQFVLNVVITFASVDEILRCDHSIKTSLQSFHMVLLVSAISKMKFWK